MSYKFQKILLTLELIVVAAVTLYTGTYAAKNPEEKVAVVETKESETAKESSESEKAGETKKIKQTKETQAKDKKQETEPETKTQQAKAKAENKNTASSGKSGNTSTTGTSKNNSSAASGGTVSKPVTTTTTKPSGNNPSNTSGTNHNVSAPSSGTSPKPNASVPGTTAPSKPQTEAPEPARPQTPETTHTHTWVEQSHTVHHDATGHYEDVVTQEAWDEPVYDMVEKSYCSTCNIEIQGDPGVHLDETMHGGYWTTWEPVQTGTIRHEAVTESRWVEDTAAWDETVSDGYRCSGCGAVK